ncbi:aminoglycoside phosphotransferase [Klebsiella pneumoniae IS39]|nr:aminoglycoside phosphotransferase [Klebsiella pneumoniae IS39]
MMKRRFLKELHSIEIDCSVSLFSDALVNKKDKFLQDKKITYKYSGKGAAVN